MEILLGTIGVILLVVGACALVIKLDNQERKKFHKSEDMFCDGDNT